MKPTTFKFGGVDVFVDDRMQQGMMIFAQSMREAGAAVAEIDKHLAELAREMWDKYMGDLVDPHGNPIRSANPLDELFGLDEPEKTPEQIALEEIARVTLEEIRAFCGEFHIAVDSMAFDVTRYGYNVRAGWVSLKPRQRTKYETIFVAHEIVQQQQDPFAARAVAKAIVDRMHNE